MKKIINGLRKILIALMAVITGVNVVTIVLQVLFRYFLKKPIAWTNELAGISLVWITFLGATLATIDQTHIGFNSIIKKLNSLPKLCMKLLCNVLIAIACYVIVRYGITSVKVGAKTMLTALPGNVAITSCIIPISGVIMFLAIVVNSVNDVKEYLREKQGNAETEENLSTALYDDVPEEVMERSRNAIEKGEGENK